MKSAGDSFSANEELLLSISVSNVSKDSMFQQLSYVGNLRLSDQSVYSEYNVIFTDRNVGQNYKKNHVVINQNDPLGSLPH